MAKKKNKVYWVRKESAVESNSSLQKQGWFIAPNKKQASEIASNIWEVSNSDLIRVKRVSLSEMTPGLLESAILDMQSSYIAHRNIKRNRKHRKIKTHENKEAVAEY